MSLPGSVRRRQEQIADSFLLGESISPVPEQGPNRRRKVQRAADAVTAAMATPLASRAMPPPTPHDPGLIYGINAPEIAADNMAAHMATIDDLPDPMTLVNSMSPHANMQSNTQSDANQEEEEEEEEEDPWTPL